MNAGLGRGLELVEGGRRIGIGPRWLARLFAGGFHKILDRIDAGLGAGSLTVHLPDGTTRLLGGRAPGFAPELTIHDWRALLRFATGGSVGWYQAWEAGEWSSPDPVPLFALLMANGESLGKAARARGPWRLAARAVHWFNRNTRAGAARNVHLHYDLGNDFYAACLDPAMSIRARGSKAARKISPPPSSTSSIPSPSGWSAPNRCSKSAAAGAHSPAGCTRRGRR